MELRDTSSATVWLEQFPEEEQEIARLILDAIFVTTTDRIKSDIESAVGEILENTKSYFYVAPVVSHEDVEDHLNLERGAQKVFAMFDEYQPLEVLKHDSGSENYLALVARDVRTSYKARALVAVTQEAFERAERSQAPIEFIFIVDNSLSGKQVSTFLESFWNSSLVTSFLNRQRTSVQVHLVCWGATAQVAAALNATSDGRKVNSTVVTEVPTVNSTFTDPEELDEIMKLIRKYPDPITRKKQAKSELGFGNVGALFLPLGASAPNNMPPLLVRNGNKSDYKALFPDRVIPPDVKALESSPRKLPLRNLDAYEAALAKRSLKTAQKLTRGGKAVDWAMMLLMASNYSETQIRTELGLSYLVSKRVLGDLIKIGWATKAFTLTEAGNMALRKFSAKQNRIDFVRGARGNLTQFDDPDEPYYPKSVRGVR